MLSRVQTNIKSNMFTIYIASVARDPFFIIDIFFINFILFYIQ